MIRQKDSSTNYVQLTLMSQCVIIISYKLCLGPCGAALICIRHLGRMDVLPTQMVLVESSLLPCVHSQLKDPATLRHAPLIHGLDSHSLISETRANKHLRSGLRG